MKGKQFNDTLSYFPPTPLSVKEQSNELLKGKYACEMQTLRNCSTFDWQLHQREREKREQRK